MDIEWFGHRCFRLKGKGLSIVTDPIDEKLALRASIPDADIVTLSHLPVQNGDPAAIPAKRKVLRGPGEYEFAGVFITGIRTYRDGKRGAERGPNTVYRIRTEGLRICHLGALGHALSAEQASAVGAVDIAFVPVGGESLTPAQASETARALEAKVIIPMPFRKAPGEKTDPVQALLKELGVAAPAPVQKHSLTASTVPAEPSAVLFRPAA
jgi:L-ascorbate metabolism protein UlaG (beta-lactamase superfamily)